MSNKSNYPVYWEHSKHEEIFISGSQKNKLPPLEILNWLFRFDSESGKLFRIRESSGKLYQPEREVNAVSGAGYLQASVTDSSGLEKFFKVHQIIYSMVSGVEPLQIVDHIDGNSLNNKFDNLRLTTDSGNSRNRGMQSNNTSGITGVYWNKQKNKWQAQAYDNAGKRKHLGYFSDIHEAANVVQRYRSNPELGYSVRHGSMV